MKFDKIVLLHDKIVNAMYWNEQLNSLNCSVVSAFPCMHIGADREQQKATVKAWFSEVISIYC